uniref:Uncharacterized protein n=1 Tax=Anguilla anguilla TaxID=7936 RepID=A0A0E9PNS0_ANGAN
MCILLNLLWLKIFLSRNAVIQCPTLYSKN